MMPLRNSNALVLALLVLAICVGLGLRLAFLTEFPAGIHGDEAWTGIRGRDILTSGHIGVWDDVHSIGQPAGIAYMNAAITVVLGQSIFGLRLVHALAACLAFGAFAVFATLTLKHRLGAVVATTFYALADTEILLGRVAFPPIWGQALLISSLAALAWATRPGARASLSVGFAAGLLLGALVYFYAATVPVGVVIALGLPIYLRAARVAHAIGLYTTFLLGGLIAIAPLVYQIASGHETISRYNVSYSADLWEMLLNYGRIAWGMFVQGARDGVDGTGTIQPIAFALSAFALIGAARLFFQPNTLRPLGIALIVVLFSSIAVSAYFVAPGTGLYRRGMAVMIPLCWLAGFAIRGLPTRLVMIALVAVYAESGFRIAGLINNPFISLVYAEPFTEAINTVADLDPPPNGVYLASARIRWDHEVRRYLVPDMQGFDISKEFSDHASPLLDRFAPGSAVILLDGYLTLDADFRSRADIAFETVLTGIHGDTMAYIFRVAP